MITFLLLFIFFEIFYVVFLALSASFSFVSILLPFDINVVFASFGEYLAWLDILINVDTLLIVFTFVITFEFYLFLYHFITWVINKVPFFKGGRG